MIQSENDLFLSLLPNANKRITFTPYSQQASKFNLILINDTQHEVALELQGQQDGLFYLGAPLNCESSYYKTNPACHWRLIKAAPTEMPAVNGISPLFYIQSIEKTITDPVSNGTRDVILMQRELFDGNRGDLLSMNNVCTNDIYTPPALLPIEELDDAKRFRLVPWTTCR